jgi:hypothetical protein
MGVRQKSGWHRDFQEEQAILSVPTAQHGTERVSKRPALGCVTGRSLTFAVLYCYVFVSLRAAKIFPRPKSVGRKRIAQCASTGNPAQDH